MDVIDLHLIESGSFQQCLICKTLVKLDEKCFRCPWCRKAFHDEHIKIWLTTKKTCPICKGSINIKPFPKDQKLSNREVHWPGDRDNHHTKIRRSSYGFSDYWRDLGKIGRLGVLLSSLWLLSFAPVIALLFAAGGIWGLMRLGGLKF